MTDTLSIPNEKKILVIGSAVADVIITLEDYLPRTGQDVHVRSQEMRLGGCAYNTFDMIRHFKVPSIPFFSVGKGAYGDFVRGELVKRGICSPIPTPEEENGCCYCFIEPNGERTFISYHGVEYRFYEEWFTLLNPEEIDSVYVCGLEIEEKTGINLVRFLEANPHLKIFFAPGPRFHKISRALMDRMLALHPVLHLNHDEACALAGKENVREAALRLNEITGNTVLVTLGSEGCLYLEKGDRNTHLIPPVPTQQVDAVGAGDSHIGAVMACLHMGLSLEEAVKTANRLSSKVVSVSGALLTDQEFEDALRRS